MSDVLLTEGQRLLRDEARAFVRDEVPRQLLLDMDAERVRYPRDYLRKLAARRLLGVRFPEELGGRGLDWSHEVLALEEIGVLGASLACLYSLPTIVGEAIHAFGTRASSQPCSAPPSPCGRTSAGHRGCSARRTSSAVPLSSSP